ncbi:MAG: septal ring lytic transglycosylase RlpA family protein [Pseudolabrys sp.]|jgi:rare lipoprotein A
MKALILAAAALVAVIGSARAESGIASHYSTRELGTRTASGRPLHDGALTAAHRTLPFGSRVRVTNHANGRSVVVTITDRGPFARGRVIDITTAGARALGFSGLAHVSLVRIGKDSLMDTNAIDP